MKKKIKKSRSREWIKRHFGLYDIEDLQIGGHCGCCGKWIPDKILPKLWAVELCKKCLNIPDKKITTIGSQKRDKLESTEYILYLDEGEVDGHEDCVILQHQESETLELWWKNDQAASYVIEIDGVGYEYVRTYSESEISNFPVQ